MLKETTELFKTFQEEFYLPNYNNLKIDIFSLKLFAKQIQNHYNFIRLHRNLNFNIRFFPTMEFLPFKFHILKTVRSL